MHGLAISFRILHYYYFFIITISTNDEIKINKKFISIFYFTHLPEIKATDTPGHELHTTAPGPTDSESCVMNEMRALIKPNPKPLTSEERKVAIHHIKKSSLLRKKVFNL